jgi:hypothetical protein
MSEKTKKPAPAAPAAPAALAVIPTTPADTAIVVDPEAVVTFQHPLDGAPVAITENERKKSALRIIEKAGVAALRERIWRANGWK